MSESEAISLAGQAAEVQHFSWRAPITAELLLHDRRARWFVRCNVGGRGAAMLVVIDDETREVVETRTQPR